MLRNRELRNYLTIMICASTLGVVFIFIQSIIAGIIALIIFSTFIVSNLSVNSWRYKEIEKLSEYLRRISSGDYSFDLRDNEEGELSILKNEIYKVTLMLSKQGELLKKEKDQLADAISDISHQLKTPLTSMMVMTDLLSDINLKSEKRIEFTNNIQVQLDRMEWLLTSLLKLSKIDAGTVEFKKDLVSVHELIEIVSKPIQIPIEIKNQALNINDDKIVYFIGDKKWTSEALINILKNCVEHTQEGGEISITYNENPLYTEIIISDNGVGINKEDLPYIFKRFYKGKNASEESVGIGLAMAKSIIKSQNGDISVLSEIDKGTIFSIKFYKQII